MTEPIDTARWRACAPLLPDGGCEAVRTLCDEVDRLSALLAERPESEPRPPQTLSWPGARPLDMMIGQLDRTLSEFLVHCDRDDLDAADWQTLKHHADDLVGVGQAGLSKLGSR